MKYVLPMLIFVLFMILANSGCIPSSPPNPVNQPVATSPTTVSLPPPSQEAGQALSNDIGQNIPQPSSTEDPNVKSHLQVPLNATKLPADAVALPMVGLVPLEGQKGYKLNSRFPIEGLSMEGTLLLQAPGKWVLSGQFRSDRASFAPGQPTAQSMGTMEPQNGGGLAFTETSGEVMISFSAPIPPAEEPRLAEPREIPFNLPLDAPDNATFSIMLLPF